jgi:AraC-like DNA-binding protein
MSKQLSTTVNGDPYEQLAEEYRVAVDMKLENYSYADIAGNAKVKEQTVRKWFMTGGICYDAYQWKRQIRMQERKQRFSEIETQLHEMAADAILTLKRRLKKGSETAAINVLALAGFTPIKKIQEIPPEDSEELKLLREIIDKNEKPSEPVQAERQAN